MVALLTPNGELIKTGVFFGREDILIRSVSEAMDEWKNGRTAQEVLEMFLRSLFYKIGFIF